ncbi:hypothetical protein [Paractinoplanes brasiliensis]|uniref:hypothetical protein n=1 Tax=Paractinoplanes brasiliensis TaxID=52695 RepID=UPI00105E55C1|nr:hypothetical protein [Actinoplanes brasiliensis]GID29932.1 hypothetical protein Abr02nite_49150 [Actinoplanes brasiliensis]
MAKTTAIASGRKASEPPRSSGEDAGWLKKCSWAGHEWPAAFEERRPGVSIIPVAQRPTRQVDLGRRSRSEETDGDAALRQLAE